MSASSPAITAVAPKPMTGAPLVAIVRDRGDRRLERQALRLGHGDSPATGGVERIQVECDVPGVDPLGDRARSTPRRRPDRRRPPASPARTARPRSPRASATRSRRAPGRRTARHRASRTVGPSAAATSAGSPRPQAIANGMPQTLPDGVVSGVLKSPCASNHASPRRIPGRALRMPAMAPACVVQSPPRTSRRAVITALDEAGLRHGSRGDRGRPAMRSRFFARGSASGDPARIVGGVAVVEPRDARPAPACAASRSSRPSRRSSVGRPLHAAEVAAQRGRGAGDHDRGDRSHRSGYLCGGDRRSA